MKPSRTRAFARLAVLAAACLPPASPAGGFALIDHSARSLGVSYTDTVTNADDPSALYMNPAGLARIRDTQATVSGIYIGPRTSFEDGGSKPAFGQALGSLDADPGVSAIVPALFGSLPIGDRITAGLGFFLPFGLGTKYDDAWAGRFFAQQSRIRAYSLNASLAARFGDFYMGGGVERQKFEATLTNAVNYSAALFGYSLTLDPQHPIVISGLEGHVRLHGDDTGWAYTLGGQWQGPGGLLLGVGYRSGTRFDVRGEASFDPATQVRVQPILDALIPSGPVSVAVKTPDMLGIGLEYKVKSVSITAEGVRTGWSSVKELRILRDNGNVLGTPTPLAWRDAWRYGAGVAWTIQDGYVLRAGLARDETPIPDETRIPRSPSNSWTTLGVGAGLPCGGADWHCRIDWALGYTWVERAPISLSEAGNGTLAGSYRSHAWLAGLQYTQRF